MRLVRPDLAQAAVDSLRAATEWPHYAIFVYLACYNTVVIAPRSMIHGDLFVILRHDWQQQGNADVSVENEHVFDGHIEWEDDGSSVLRTQRGERLPDAIERGLRTFVDSLTRHAP